MRNKLIYILLALSLCIVGLLLRIFLLNKISIYPDDINFYSISLQNGFKEIITLKYWALDYPQGYFLLTKLTMLVTKDILFLKQANLIFYIISSILLILLGRRLFKDQIVSLLPLAFFSSSIFLTGIDISLNPYPLSFTLSIALLYILIRLIDRFSYKKVFIFGLLILFSTFMSYAIFLIIFALIIYISISTWKNHLNRRQYILISLIILASIIPSLLQILQIMHSLSALSPYPLSFSDAIINYLNSNLKQIINLSFIDFIIPLFLIVLFLPKQIAESVGKANYHFLPLIILISSLISLAIMQILGLNVSSRLFFAFHLGIILFISFIANKNSLLKQGAIYTIIIFFLANYHYVVGKETNKKSFERIARQMLVLCNEPQTYFIIDSSNYYFYPLYHYYILFSPYKTEERYKCVLGHTSTFDTNIKSSLINLPKLKSTYAYYFINMNQTGSMTSYFVNLCKNSNCYVFNKRLGKFENAHDRYGLERNYQKNLIKDEF